MTYKEEQELKARRKQFRRRFRMSDAEEKALTEQRKQDVFHDNNKILSKHLKK